MKNKKTSAAGIIFAFIYFFIIAGLLFSLKQGEIAGRESAQDRFIILTRETSQNINSNEIGSDAFNDRFLNSLGNLSDIAGVQLKYENNLIFSYPAEIANGTVSRSSNVSSYTTNINAKDGTTLTLSTAIYRLKPITVYRNLKIAFIVLLTVTLICLAYAIYVSVYNKEEKEDSSQTDDEEENEPVAEAEEENDADSNEEDIFEEGINSEDEIEFRELPYDDSDNTDEEESFSEEEDIEDYESVQDTEESEETVIDSDDDFDSENDSFEDEEEQSDNEENFFEDNEEDDDDEDMEGLFDDDMSLDDSDIFLDEDETIAPAKNEEDSVYSNVQISPAEYTALKEAMDETQAELEAESQSSRKDTEIHDAEEDDLYSDFDVEDSSELEDDLETNEEDIDISNEEEIEDSNAEDNELEPEETTSGNKEEKELENKDDISQIKIMHPNGLFSEKTGFGWESYMITRLDSELVRAASSEQDLSLFTIRIQDLTWFTDQGKDIAEAVKSIVNFPDLIFEYETDGITVIIPNTHIEQSLKVADDIYTAISEILQQYGCNNKIGIGISAKSLRMISGERLANESQEALKHAFEDENSPIVAFKVNPKKYRTFLAAQEEAKN